MATVDYNQTTEDHQAFLVLIRHAGRQLSWKHFSNCWERINQLDCVAIPGQKRDMWIRYKKNYTGSCNEWGDFQAHRKVLGLIAIGRCSNAAEFDTLFESYKKEKEIYSDTLFNSRLIVFGMNTDGSQLSDEQKRSIAVTPPPAISMKIDGDKNDTENCDNAHDNDNKESSVNNDKVTKNSNGLSAHTDPLRQTPTAPLAKSENSSITGSPSPKHSVEHSGGDGVGNTGSKKTLHKTLSNNRTLETPGSEVVFYPSVDNSDGLEQSVRDFVTSLFFVLEGKRLDRSFERVDRQTLLCAPFEKKDYVGIDPDSKSYKKKCQGRLRKHLADLSLLAGLPGEAMLHYTTAIDILKPVNDWLWMGGCYEGLCASSVISTYVKSQTSVSNLALRRNQSFSLKRGTANLDKNRAGSIRQSGSLANGLQDLPTDTAYRNMNTDDIIDKYKECLMFYSKYKNAGIIEIEASFKACRVLIRQRKFLQASDFLQNVVYINLQLSDEDRINRYGTLSSLYSEIGFQRKASFFKRVAAMQCVAPQNPKPSWHICHELLIQALPGYRIYLDPKECTVKPGQTSGWPVTQTRVLHELIYSAKRMGNLPLAIRYTCLLLHTLLDQLSVVDKREVMSSLVSMTSQCEGTTQTLALPSGGVVKPIPLYNIPLVKSFKLMPLHPHLEPKSTTATVTDNVFIFTPLNLAPCNTETVKTDVDFCWVQGDVCEIQLQVYNPMPDELKITNLGLITEGLEIETFPTSVSIAPESGPCLVKIMSRPLAAGELTVLGYTSQVYGVRSNCKLKDCVTFPQPYYKVKVIAALPQIQLSSSLPKSASFLSFGEEFNVVTSASTVLYSGQSCECQVTIQNNSKQSVERVSVSMEHSRKSKGDVGNVFQWNKENIDSQLPIQVSGLLCFNMALHGIGDFIVPSLSKDILKSSTDSLDRNLASEGKCVEAIIKVEYSGGEGMVVDYCRCCSIAFSVDILPSVVFHKWDVISSDSCDHCQLVLDIQNVSGHNLELHYTKQCLHLKHEQIQRICIQLERCPPPIHTGGDKPQDSFSQYLATFVDIHWTIVSLCKPSSKISGKVDISGLQWSIAQQQLVYVSPVSWDIHVNGQLYSPLHIGAFEHRVGDVVELSVDINIKPDIQDIEGSCGVVSICCCQYCDNGCVSYDTCHQVMPLGEEHVSVLQLSPDVSISHSCSYIFSCCGFYRFELQMKIQPKGSIEVKGQSDIPHQSLQSLKGHIDDKQTWKCSNVIEIHVID